MPDVILHGAEMPSFRRLTRVLRLLITRFAPPWKVSHYASPADDSHRPSLCVIEPLWYAFRAAMRTAREELNVDYKDHICLECTEPWLDQGGEDPCRYWMEDETSGDDPACEWFRLKGRADRGEDPGCPQWCHGMCHLGSGEIEGEPELVARSIPDTDATVSKTETTDTCGDCADPWREDQGGGNPCPYWCFDDVTLNSRACGDFTRRATADTETVWNIDKKRLQERPRARREHPDALVARIAELEQNEDGYKTQIVNLFEASLARATVIRKYEKMIDEIYEAVMELGRRTRKAERAARGGS